MSQQYSSAWGYRSTTPYRHVELPQEVGRQVQSLRDDKFYAEGREVTSRDGTKMSVESGGNWGGEELHQVPSTSERTCEESRKKRAEREWQLKKRQRKLPESV
jgi:hypothetical protein